MASVQLINQRTREVHLRNDIQKPGQVQFQANSNFNVKFSPDGTRCVATIYQSLENKAGEQGFSASVTLEGLFVCTDVKTDEDKRQAHVAAYEALFPFLQSAVSQLFASTGLPGFMVKKLDMSRDKVILTQGKNKPTLPIV